MKYTLTFLLSFLVHFAIAQNEETFLRQDNDKTVKQEWYGTIDGIHPIHLTLQIKNGKCVGKYTLLSSKQTFELEGNLENHDIFLQEIDDQLKISGNLSFKNSEEKVSGIWSHPLGYQFLRMDLWKSGQETNDFNCQESNWRKIYFGILDKSNLKVQILKENNRDLKIDLSLDRINISGISKCLSDDCRSFEVTAPEFEHIYTKFIFTFLEDNRLSLQVLKKEGSNSMVRLTLDDHLKFNCQNYANYNSRFDIIYPEISNEFFNGFIDMQLKSFGVNKIRTNSLENHIPENRFSENISIWTDIHYFSKKYISGIITKQSNLKGDNQRIAFVIDLEKSKVLSPGFAFKKPQNLIQRKKSFLSDQKKNYRPFQLELIKDWIATEKFEYVTISKNGFLFITEFNNIFGERQILLPYGKLSKDLKKDFVKDLDIE